MSDSRIDSPTILPTTYYYRWSTPGQVKEKRFNGREFVEVKKEIVEAEVQKLKAEIENYRSICPKCHKEIRLMLQGNGYLDLGITGRKLGREYIDDLIQDAKEAKFSVVVTPFASRIGRKVSVSATIRDLLKDLGVQIYSIAQPVTIRCPECFDPLENDAAVIMETVSDMQSQLELSSIRRNYKNGMPIRIRKGLIAGITAYGLVKKYKSIAGVSGNDRPEEYYVWDDAKTDIVKRICQEYLGGAGCWGIARKLNQEGIPSSKGGNWGRSAILVILKNPVYTGLSRWGWKKTIKGKRVIQPRDKWMLEKARFQGIFNLNYWESIQAEIKRRAEIGGRAASSTALLIGLLKCGYCGHSMFQVKDSKTRLNGKRYTFYGYACGGFLHFGICRHNGISQTEINNLVLREVLKLANDKTRQTMLNKLSKTQHRNAHILLKEKEKRLRQLNLTFERMVKAYQAGVDSLAEYQHHKNELLPAINATEGEIAKLKREQSQSSNFEWTNSYEKALKKLMASPDNEDIKVVRYILGRLIEKIEFTREPKSLKIIYRVESDETTFSEAGRHANMEQDTIQYAQPSDKG